MAETLYTVVEGPKGKVEVYEVTQDKEPDAWQQASKASARMSDVLYEIRFGKARQSFWQEGEAVSVASEWAGLS